MQETNNAAEVVKRVRLTVVDDALAPTVSTSPIDLIIWVYRYNICQGTGGSFNGIPANGLQHWYAIGASEPLVIEFTGLDNGECDYSVEIWDTTYQTPFSVTAFSAVQPVL